METTQSRAEHDRAPEQAAIQLESIVEMVERLRHARECPVSNCAAGSVGGDGYNAQEYHDAAAARDSLTDSPLSVEVRTDWHTVGAVDACKPTDYKRHYRE
jgi:hypothetical protein